MNILIAARNDWSGAGYALMQAINEHTEHTARAICYNRTYLDYSCDVFAPQPDRVLQLAAWADMWNLHDGGNLIPREAEPRPVVATYHGSWYRRNWRAVNPAADRLGYIQTCLTMDLTQYGPRWIGRSIADLSHSHIPALDTFQVAHAPTGREKKGTDRIIEGLRGLEGVMLDLIEYVPNDECLRRKAHAHLFIDQMVDIVGHGTNSLEAWAIGIPVISNASETVRKLIVDHIGFIPFYLTQNVRELREAVKLFRDNAEFYAHWQAIGARYIRRWHAPQVVAARFIELCEEARCHQAAQT